jgi:ABC-type multidrug transport system permease subunit
VADRGRTIVCTIHQPSTDVFELFDQVLLLRRGGETVFFGPRDHLVPYFESLPGVSSLPTGQNPATWMLDVIGAGVTTKKKAALQLPVVTQRQRHPRLGARTSEYLVSPSASASSTDNEEDDHEDTATISPIDVDFAASFSTSHECAGVLATLAQPGFTMPLPSNATSHAVVFSSKRAATSATQMRALVRRFFDMYWRTPSYNLTRWVLALALGFVFGLAALSADYTTYQGLNSGIGLIFMTTIYNGIVSYTGVLPFAARERASFYRERASQTYNALWYWLGSTLAEIPYVFVTSLLFTVLFYPLAGFGTTAGAFSWSGLGTFLFYWLNVSLFLLGQTYVGQLLAFALPSVEVAAVVGTVFNTVCLLFAGFNPPADSIPAGYQWLFTITPHRYSLSVLVTLVFSNCPDSADESTSSALGCKALSNAPVALGDITVQGYVEQVFKMRRDDMLSNFGYVFVFLAIYRALALLALRYINHQKR